MRTDSTDYAGICRKVVMPTVITAGTGKTVGEDAEFEVLVKRLADVGAWRMVIALAVELADACQLRPGLEVFGYRLLKQGSLGLAYYVSIIPFGRVLI